MNTPLQTSDRSSDNANANAGKAYDIHAPAQVRALSSGVRQEILDAMESAGPCSIAELAETLGRSPDRLYFHVRRLAKVGLLNEVERRKNGRHVALVYDVPGRPMQMHTRRAGGRGMKNIAGAMLRLAQRDYAKAIDSPQSVLDGEHRTLWAARSRGWLTEHEIARLNELLSEAASLVRSGRRREGASSIALAFAMTPIVLKKVKTKTARSTRSRDSGRT